MALIIKDFYYNELLLIIDSYNYGLLLLGTFIGTFTIRDSYYYGVCCVIMGSCYHGFLLLGVLNLWTFIIMGS